MLQSPADILFGQYRRRVFGQLLLHPEQSYHVRELARITGTSAGTLHKELAKLASVGILSNERRGNQLVYQANTACPIYDELASIMRKTSGLTEVIAQALEPLDGKVPSGGVGKPFNPFNPNRHHRRSIRLRGYDYSRAGAYFVTICVKDRVCLFGEVVNGEMRLNEIGLIVREAWAELPSRHAGVRIDKFVVMPNHVHGIIVLSKRDPDDERIVGARFIAPTNGPTKGLPNGHAPPNGRAMTERFKRTSVNPSSGELYRGPTLGSIVRAFKGRITNTINTIRQTPGVSVWQRNFYEHIIRDDEDLKGVRQYIINNPTQWASDHENRAVVITGS